MPVERLHEAVKCLIQTVLQVGMSADNTILPEFPEVESCEGNCGSRWRLLKWYTGTGTVR